MAQTMETALTIIYLRSTTLKHILWYRERLQTKYGKPATNPLLAVGGDLNLSFRDSSERRSVLLEEQRGPQSRSSPGPGKSISKENACFSKLMSRKQTRRERVSSLEAKLTQHPLLMFPHYQDHMSPEVFDQVVSILDPDVCVNKTCTPSKGHTDENHETRDESTEERGKGKSGRGRRPQGREKTRQTHQEMTCPSRRRHVVTAL
ncbi:protein FAM47E [Salarias fasciatus]|uniref:protein FAM47E n=1 Tax=Salarias fasciatus TaxID=181472 RepID=UPI001176C3E9|nr:uncharacterized protein LOC115398258 [Salarias fasciatus]